MSPRLHLELRVRKADDQPPYPGPYRVNSRDPELWLMSWGIAYDAQGRLSLGRSGVLEISLHGPDELGKEQILLTPPPCPSKAD